MYGYILSASTIVMVLFSGSPDSLVIGAITLVGSYICFLLERIVNLLEENKH